MRRKLIYIVFLVMLAGVIVPIVYSQRINGTQASYSGVPGPGAVNPAPEDQQPAAGAGPAAGAPDWSDIPPVDQGRPAGGLAGGQGEQTGTTGQDIFPAPAQPGNVGTSAEKRGCNIGLAVVGMNGELLFGPGDVRVTENGRAEVTALDALGASGLEYETGRWSNFIESVAGQRNRGQAGWMYAVNGKVPVAAADQTPLQDGDRVVWWYSQKVGSPVPDWDRLLNKR